MFFRISKIIGLIVIILVSLGHHSFQVYAMENTVPHTSCGIETHCDHYEMEICESIQNDEVQTSPQVFIVSESEDFIINNFQKTVALFFNHEHDFKKINLSYQQLARSHLSYVN